MPARTWRIERWKTGSREESSRCPLSGQDLQFQIRLHKLATEQRVWYLLSDSLGRSNYHVSKSLL